MTLHQLNHVAAAARTGSFSEAAKQLFLSQPSLTVSIRELERELGITIFRRTNKGATLTPEGEEFLGYARQVLEQTRLMEEKYCGAAPGQASVLRQRLPGLPGDQRPFPRQMQEEYLRLNNLAIAGKPEDLALTTHVCRGNYHSTWASQGGYAPVAPFLFAQENVDAFYLEFDDERSGNFEPLKYVAEGKKVVLGLVTTKNPRLEDKQTIIARIHEAARYIPLDRLCLSPQCGFASCEIGNKLTEMQQWAKLALVKEIAEEVWGK